MSTDICTEYTTIEDVAEGIYTEQRSKFISFAIPVGNEEIAREIVAQYRKRFFDARHVCWGYVIGIPPEQIERLSDDGEPSSTAGKPIVNRILQYGLTNVLVIVVRYFGGVKLGCGGLIAAYRTAAEEALNATRRVTHVLKKRYVLRYPFDLINPIIILLKNYSADTVSTDSDENGYIHTVDIPYVDVATFERESSTYYQLSVKA